MVIRIVDIVSGADTADQGTAVFDAIKSALASEEIVVVSFERVKTATPSFVSTGFVPLLAVLSFSDIKRRIRIVESTRQINQMIKSRLEKESAIPVEESLR